MGASGVPGIVARRVQLCPALEQPQGWSGISERSLQGWEMAPCAAEPAFPRGGHEAGWELGAELAPAQPWCALEASRKSTAPLLLLKVGIGA